MITEHRGHARTCPCCGEVTRAAIPADIREHSVGPRLTAVLSYFTGVQGVSKRGVEEIADDPSSSVEADPAPPPDPRPASSARPSIVVLPFANLSAEPDTEYFSYGLTEDIIRLLARHRWLDVLSRHSGAPFKVREVDPREIDARRVEDFGRFWTRLGDVLQREARFLGLSYDPRGKTFEPV